METKKNLHEILAEIQSELVVKKDLKNKFADFNYRKASQILEKLKPYCRKYGITFTIKEEIAGYFTTSSKVKEVETVIKAPIVKSTATISNGKDEISGNSFSGVQIGKKGMDIPQQFGTSSSYGKKYALENLLAIDNNEDPDSTSGKPEEKETNSKMKENVADLKKASGEKWKERKAIESAKARLWGVAKVIFSEDKDTFSAFLIDRLKKVPEDLDVQGCNDVINYLTSGKNPFEEESVSSMEKFKGFLTKERIQDLIDSKAIQP